MFFVDFSSGVLFDFHGLQINKLQLKKTRSRSTGFRILIRINRRCSGEDKIPIGMYWSEGLAGLIPHADELEIRYRSVYIGQRGWRV